MQTAKCCNIKSNFLQRPKNLNRGAARMVSDLPHFCLFVVHTTYYHQILSQIFFVTLGCYGNSDCYFLTKFMDSVY